MKTFLLTLGLFSFIGRPPAPPPSRPGFGALQLPTAMSKKRLQGLLQRFVREGYQRSFRRLGAEDDFDHGHLLLGGPSGEPIAILYHTQELADAPAGPDGRVAPRSWLQRVDDGAIRPAVAYQRRKYPSSPSWDSFVHRDLPRLRQRRTVVEKMLDPALLGTEVSGSIQWVFTRVPCDGSQDDAASRTLGISLPNRTRLCLTLSTD